MDIENKCKGLVLISDVRYIQELERTGVSERIYRSMYIEAGAWTVTKSDLH